MGGPLNLVPGNKYLNNSDYKSFENDLRDFHNDGYTVDVEFKAVYSLGNTNSRPDGFEIAYSLDGGRVIREPFTNEGSKIE